MKSNYYWIKYGIPLGLTAIAFFISLRVWPNSFISISSLTLAISKTILDIFYNEEAFYILVIDYDTGSNAFEAWVKPNNVNFERIKSLFDKEYSTTNLIGK